MLSQPRHSSSARWTDSDLLQAVEVAQLACGLMRAKRKVMLLQHVCDIEHPMHCQPPMLC
jgi:hypothetical protein